MSEVKQYTFYCDYEHNAYEDECPYGGWVAHKDFEELEAKLAKAVGAAVDTAASLAAAISMLEKGGKKVAPSNKMFDQMMADYRASLERTRATIAELKGQDDDPTNLPSVSYPL